MKNPKQGTKEKRRQEPTYSYDEYQRTFFPKPPMQEEKIQEPSIFGAKLAEEALRQLAAEESER